jgi:hypothetical protein
MLKAKISASDDYINIEDASLFNNPLNALNTKPTHSHTMN